MEVNVMAKGVYSMAAKMKGSFNMERVGGGGGGGGMRPIFQLPGRGL